MAQLARCARRATIVAIDACRDEVSQTGEEAAGVTAGLARAKSEGKALGRPRALTDTQEAEALQRLSGGEAVAAVARALKTSRATVMRIRDAQAA